MFKQRGGGGLFCGTLGGAFARAGHFVIYAHFYGEEGLMSRTIFFDDGVFW